MNKLITICALSVALNSYAATPSTVTISFTWPTAGQTVDMGGIPTNLYLTNISFNVYSTKNVNTPLTNWTVLTNWQALPLIVQGPVGSTWSNSIPVDGSTRFFALTAVSVKAAGSGESPFSNTDFQLETLPPGQIGKIK